MRGHESGFPGIFLIVLFSFLPAVSSAGQTSEQGTPYFTNKDIEKYAEPADDRQPAVAAEKPRTTAADAGETSRDKKEVKEKEHWCRRASSARKALGKKQDRIDETEREIAERTEGGSSGGKTVRSLQKRLEKAKREQRYAEKNLGEIEDEAHRKGIPPGWLRCQFE